MPSRMRSLQALGQNLRHGESIPRIEPARPLAYSQRKTFTAIPPITTV